VERLSAHDPLLVSTQVCVCVCVRVRERAREREREKTTHRMSLFVALPMLIISAI